MLALRGCCELADLEINSAMNQTVESPGVVKAAMISEDYLDAKINIVNKTPTHKGGPRLISPEITNSGS